MNAAWIRLRVAAISLTLFCLGGAATAAADPCPLTSKSREWSSICFEFTPTGRKIKKQYIHKVVFDTAGFAPIVVSSPPELIVINKRGRVVPVSRRRLAGFDFEPAEGELARFGYFAGKAREKDTTFKCGFYRSGKFEIAVPPLYDQCDSFNAGRALVCFGCKDHCESGDCHESNFAGGEGLIIDEKNKVIARFPLPQLPLCEAGRKIEPANHGETKCRPRAPNPFDQFQ